MTTSELITPQHLTRKAIIYIRQSSRHQVLTNQESLRLQYALRERAVGLGWRTEEIEIIDGDLGLSGAATHYREGFKELLTRVTLGEVGIILSGEVQRLSRNCSDWYPLLDLCGYRQCLIADRDGVYDPGTPNGRLFSSNTTASGRVTRKASERSGVQASARTHRFSLREGPLGQEGEPYARLAKLVPCPMGMQVSRGHHPQVQEAGVLREIEAADRRDLA